MRTTALKESVSKEKDLNIVRHTRGSEAGSVTLGKSGKTVYRLGLKHPGWSYMNQRSRGPMEVEVEERWSWRRDEAEREKKKR